MEPGLREWQLLPVSPSMWLGCLLLSLMHPRILGWPGRNVPWVVQGEANLVLHSLIHQ